MVGLAVDRDVESGSGRRYRTSGLPLHQREERGAHGRQVTLGPVLQRVRVWHVLLFAFAARLAVGLANDGVLYPDEIMQYLEQAHRLVFGAGMVPWE